MNNEANLNACIRHLELIAANPIDVKLLKKELKEQFDTETIKTAKKRLKGE